MLQVLLIWAGRAHMSPVLLLARAATPTDRYTLISRLFHGFHPEQVPPVVCGLAGLTVSCSG